MSKNSFYTSSTPGTSFYTGSTSGTEADMRSELAKTFNGTYPEVAKAQTGLLRRMRRDSNGRLTPCSCIDLVTKEQDKDYFCPFCFGMGFLWDEEELQLYKVLEDSDTDNALKDKLGKPGLINVPIVVFYIKYDSNITKNDKIIELFLDLDGTVTTPYSRKALYRVEVAWDYRCDNGKLEYWKVFTHKETVRYLNTPSN